MREYFLKQNSFSRRVKVEPDLSNYTTKSNFKSETGVDTLKFSEKVDLAIYCM